MDRVCAMLASPAAPIALLAAVAWAPATGFPTWVSMARGRFASTATVSAAIAVAAFGRTARHLLAQQR
jgi:hypothetical protein